LLSSYEHPHGSAAEPLGSSSLATAKLRKIERRTKETRFFFMPRWSNFAIFIAKLRISERNAKEKRIFFLLLFQTKGLENLLSLASARNSAEPNLQKKSFTPTKTVFFTSHFLFYAQSSFLTGGQQEHCF
jgi:hypothetical protein